MSAIAPAAIMLVREKYRIKALPEARPDGRFARRFWREIKAFAREAPCRVGEAKRAHR
jgi:hypothetical protein